MRFLISRLSSLGDVVCTLPAAAALKSTYPDSSVSWVVGKRFADVVRCCSAVDEVVQSKKSLARSAWPELAEPFDAAFDLQGLFKSAWPVHLVRSPRKLGYHWQREGASLFSQKVAPDPTSFHIVDQYVDVVRAFGAEAGRANFSLVPPATELEEVKARLLADAVERFVVLNPGAGWATKRWPPSSFAQVAQALGERGITAILVGGGSEEDLAVANEVAGSANGKPHIWTGKTTVAELIALVSLAKAHLGGDTGSTHIAAALGIPCVGLYSVTNPRRSCPYGQIDNCLYDQSSLNNILPERVLAKLDEVLA